MSSSVKIPVLNLLLRSLAAPFTLEAASWMQLLRPAGLVVLLVLLSFGGGYIGLGETVRSVLAMLFWAAQAWFAIEYLKQLILGPQDAQPVSLKQYGHYLILLILIGLLLAIFLGFLLQLTLPAMIWFTMAINSPQPWLAAGSVLLWTIVVLIASYPIVRISMILPAVSAGQSINIRSIWSISTGNGVRLLLALVLIPGFLTSVLYLLLEPLADNVYVVTGLTLLGVYFALVYLSLLALSYQTLSGLGEQRLSKLSGISFQKLLRPLVFIILIASGLLILNDAVYHVGENETVVISGPGSEKRVESESGIKLKMPFVEKATSVSVSQVQTASGDGRFFTTDKATIRLDFEASWKVVDAERFTITLAGKTRLASMRIAQFMEQQLRNYMLKVNPEMIRIRLAKESIDSQNSSDIPAEFEPLLHQLNKPMKALGIEVTGWKVSEAAQ